jgi:glycosyltransferase involved in cell wall biosynthesis
VPEPIRVLQFLADAQPGGGMTQMLQLSTWMDHERVALQYAVPDDGPLFDALRNLGARVAPIKLRGRIDPAGIRRLAHLCRAERIQVLHSHNARADINARLAGRWASVPAMVSTIHNSVFNYDIPASKQRFYAASERWTSRLAVAIVAVSPGISRELIEKYRIPGEKVVVVPNGIDPKELQARVAAPAMRRDLGVGASAPLLVQVGRLTEQKGFDVLLQALVAIVESRPDVRALFVGTGPQRQELEALCRRLGLTDTVIFLGHRKDIPDLYAAADLVILASRSEGMPYTLLEAMGIGCCVVGTEIGGIIDVIEPERTGILVPSEDPETLATRVLELLGNAERRQALGSAAKEQILEGFTAQHTAAQLTALYERILAGRPVHEREAVS